MELVDEKGWVICQVCGKSFRGITPAHVKSHQLDIKQYRQNYPDAPLSSEGTKALRRYKDSTLFKEDKITDVEAEVKIEEFQIDKIPVIKGKTKRVNDFVEEVKVFAQDTTCEFHDPTNSIHRDKLKILSFLLSIYPDIQNSYFIEKYSIGKTLEYRLVTDICSPHSRVDFEFPNTFWHNQDMPKITRDEKLRRDGWKIITIKGPKPSIDDIKKVLN